MDTTVDALSLLCQELGMGQPYLWQHQAFDRLLAGDVPAQIKVPTGGGKTLMLLIFVAALATQAAQGNPRLQRRLVLVVNRRALVDEATRLCERLREALETRSALATVRRALASLSATGQALAVSTLRGQWADNGAWSLDPSVPALILATPDMLGSRLLFRGYGVGRSRSATHAGLLGVDTLVIHDEAHLAPAFNRLLRQLETMAAPGAARIGRPALQFVEMTATLASASPRPALVCDVNADPALQQRMRADKRLRLVALPLVGAKYEAAGKAVADEMARQALALRRPAQGPAPQDPVRAVAVFINRPMLAERVAAALRKAGVVESAIVLLTGTMRGHERNALVDQPAFQCFSTEPSQRSAAQQQLAAEPGEEVAYFIATAAGEIGLDIDADAALFDLSTVERFIQRCGRVNRRGCRQGSITLVHAAGQECPPALQAPCVQTLALLAELPVTAPSRTDSPQSTPEPERDASPLALSGLLNHTRYPQAIEPLPRTRALEPALLHLYALTSLRLDELAAPDPALFIHGLEPEAAELHLAWRELPEAPAGSAAWAAWLDAWPLSRHEMATVPLEQSRALLEQVLSRPRGSAGSARPLALRLDPQGQWADDGLWCEGAPVSRWLKGLRPGTTVLLAAEIGGLSLGLPSETATEPVLDVSGHHTDAQGLQREGIRHIQVRWERDDDGSRWRGQPVTNNSPEPVAAADAEEPSPGFETLDALLSHLVPGHAVVFHDGPAGPPPSESWQGTVRCWLAQPGVRSPDSEDLAALAPQDRLLTEHLDLAQRAARQLALCLGLSPELSAELQAAAKAHDEGKARTLWQRALGNAPPAPALAKSRRSGFNHRINQGYRHELGSLTAPSSTGPTLAPLSQHLVASHHGWARPGFRDAARRHPACAQAADAATSRFGQLHHALGPWALAWLEAVLKAADVLAEVRAEDWLAQAANAPVEAPRNPAPPLALALSAAAELSWRLPVDVLNFGEYLAALGLVSLLARQPEAFTVAWDAGAMVLRGVGESHVLAVLHGLGNATVEVDEAACSRVALSDSYPAMLLAVKGIDPIPLNSWLNPALRPPVKPKKDPAFGYSGWKLATGNSNADLTLNNLRKDCAASLDLKSFSAERIFQIGSGQHGKTSKFRFDSATNWKTIDAGFSLNDEKPILKGVRPWVELLSAIGLQFAFCPPGDRFTHYHCWEGSLPPVLVLAAARGLLPVSHHGFAVNIIQTNKQLWDVYPSHRNPQERKEACPSIIRII